MSWKQRYYYSPQREICETKHSKYYTECLQHEVCPFGSCYRCKIDFLSLDELGELN